MTRESVRDGLLSLICGFKNTSIRKSDLADYSTFFTVFTIP